MFDLAALFLFPGEFYAMASAPVPFRASYVPPIGNIKFQIFSIVSKNDPVDFSEQ